jgi:hypothetical protein
LFKELTNAYETLSNKQTRFEYDKTIIITEKQKQGKNSQNAEANTFYYQYTKNDSYTNHFKQTNDKRYKVYKSRSIYDNYHEEFYQPEPPDTEISGKYLIIFVGFMFISVLFICFCFISTLKHSEQEGFYHRHAYYKPLSKGDVVEQIIRENETVNEIIKLNRNI